MQHAPSFEKCYKYTRQTAKLLPEPEKINRRGASQRSTDKEPDKSQQTKNETGGESDKGQQTMNQIGEEPDKGQQTKNETGEELDKGQQTRNQTKVNRLGTTQRSTIQETRGRSTIESV